MTLRILRHLWYYPLAAKAWAIGLFYRWPQRPPIPQWHSGVSAGLQRSAEARSMYVGANWKPHCFQWTRLYGISRSFKVPMTAEEIEYERASAAWYDELAEAYYRDERSDETPGAAWDDPLRDDFTDDFEPEWS